jgi:hypothetical protein
MRFLVGGLLFVGVFNGPAIVGFYFYEGGDLGFACFAQLQANCERRTFFPLSLGS